MGRELWRTPRHPRRTFPPSGLAKLEASGIQGASGKSTLCSLQGKESLLAGGAGTGPPMVSTQLGAEAGEAQALLWSAQSEGGQTRGLPGPRRGLPRVGAAGMTGTGAAGTCLLDPCCPSARALLCGARRPHPNLLFPMVWVCPLPPRPGWGCSEAGPGDSSVPACPQHDRDPWEGVAPPGHRDWTPELRPCLTVDNPHLHRPGSTGRATPLHSPQNQRLASTFLWQLRTQQCDHFIKQEAGAMAAIDQGPLGCAGQKKVNFPLQFSSANIY